MARKTVFGVSDKARLKPISSVTETSKKLCWSQTPEEKFSPVEAHMKLKHCNGSFTFQTSEISWLQDLPTNLKLHLLAKLIYWIFKDYIFILLKVNH